MMTWPYHDVSNNEAYQAGAFKASLMDMPPIENLTEKESAHPSQQQLDKLTGSGPTAALFSTGSPPADLTESNFDSLPSTSQKNDYINLYLNPIPNISNNLISEITSKYIYSGKFKL